MKSKNDISQVNWFKSWMKFLKENDSQKATIPPTWFLAKSQTKSKFIKMWIYLTTSTLSQITARAYRKFKGIISREGSSQVCRSQWSWRASWKLKIHMGSFCWKSVRNAPSLNRNKGLRLLRSGNMLKNVSELWILGHHSRINNSRCKARAQVESTAGSRRPGQNWPKTQQITIREPIPPK